MDDAKLLPNRRDFLGLAPPLPLRDWVQMLDASAEFFASCQSSEYSEVEQAAHRVCRAAGNKPLRNLFPLSEAGRNHADCTKI
jgi:hypothetical protein